MAEERANPEAGEEKKKKGKFGLILIVLLVLLLGGGGAYVWFFVLGKSDQAAEVQTPIEEKTADNPAASRSQEEMGPLFHLDSFVVNLYDKEGERYLKVTLELEMDREELRDELTKRVPQLRDTIIALLSSKSFEEVSSLAGKQLLKSEIKLRVNRLLTTGQIKRVYFTEFVVQ